MIVIPDRSTRSDRALAWGLGLLTIAIVWATQRSVGFVRDEGYYFTAGDKYAGWFLELGRDFRAGHFLDPFRDATIVQHWSYNSEHPVLAKTLYTLSNLTFFQWLGWLDRSTAFRLPAFFMSGVVTWALFWLARPYGRVAAVLAPVLFWAVPRHFFHAHLACFDIPVVATWCVFFLTYARAIETRQGAWKAGLAFGLALATKHNAFFLPFAAVLHWLLTDWRDLRAAGVFGIFRRIPATLWAMALLGPLVLYVHWPYLWHHPIDRVRDWIGFHQNHVHYPWQYLGTVLRGPPFPVVYPLVLEGLTVPAATLFAMALGTLLIALKCGGSFVSRVGRAFGEATSREWLLLLGIATAVVPFMTTAVPIFGGIKHWMAGLAAAAVLGAALIHEAGRALAPRSPQLAAGAIGLLIFVPATEATAHFHPFGTSAYTELAGGAAGGAALGMQRQYWSNNVTAVIPWLNENAPKNALIYFHEVNVESFQAYQRDGHLRKDIRYAWTPQDAVIAAYQYHQEFRDREFEIWSEFGTRTPAVSFAIDEAPQVVVYVRPGTRLGH